MIESDKIEPRLYAQIVFAQENPDKQLISCIVFCNHMAKSGERGFLVDHLGMSDYDDAMGNSFHGVISYNQLKFLADQEWIVQFRPALYRSISELGFGHREMKQKDGHIKVRFRSKSDE